MRNIILLSTAVGMVLAIFVVIAFKSSESSRSGMSTQPSTVNQAADYPPKAQDTSSVVVAEDSTHKSSEPIFLTIIEPQTNTHVTTANINVKGKTLPDAEVFVNDKSLISDKKGGFEVPMVLDAGENEINIMAHDSNGDFKEANLIITYDPI